MPNHCQNHLVIEGPPEDLKKFMDLVHTEDSLFTFHNIAPRPKELEEVSSGSDELGYKVKYTDEWKRIANYSWLTVDGTPTREKVLEALRADNPKVVELADKYKANVDKFGHATWYTWSIDNWGTKWDAYEPIEVAYEDGSSVAEVLFTTAWGPPDSFLWKVIDMFPALTITNRWSEEGGCEGYDTYED